MMFLLHRHIAENEWASRLSGGHQDEDGEEEK